MINDILNDAEMDQLLDNFQEQSGSIFNLVVTSD